MRCCFPNRLNISVSPKLEFTSRNRSKRRLFSNLVNYMDPKSVTMKTPEATRNHFPQTRPQPAAFHFPYDLPRPLNILALGGSVTFGERLADRYESFPFLVGSPYVDSVDNFATQATSSAEYPSLCLESILLERQADNKSYDLIFLEFSFINSSSSLQGLHLLLRRLVQRYPEAVIIYIHLYPLLAMVEEANTGIRPLRAAPSGHDLDLDWKWIAQHEPNYSEGAIPFGQFTLPKHVDTWIQEVGGYVYNLPFPSNPKDAMLWFSDDWWHLSYAGHVEVANGILSLISQMQKKVLKQHKRLVDNSGDQCYNWFSNGIVTLEDYSGCQLVNIVEMGKITNLQKWVLEVDPYSSGATITFESKFSSPNIPIYVSYLSVMAPAELSVVEVAANTKDDFQRIDPNIMGTADTHIPLIQKVGVARPGKNTLHIKTVDQRQNPFRIVGVYMCATCDTESKVTGTMESPKDPADFLIETTVDISPPPPKAPTLSDNSSRRRPIQILALGGSNTWGAFLPDRYRAYPWLIGEALNNGDSNQVDNVAMRATGADYPSLCLESMIPNSADKNYDVILFDFVLNGTNGFSLLLKRLRERYPDAVLVYVHIWNILSLAREASSGKSPGAIGLNPDLDWVWAWKRKNNSLGDSFNPNGDGITRKCPREICDGSVMEQLTIDAGGYIYKVPIPETPKQALLNETFGPDWQVSSNTTSMSLLLC